MSSGKAFPKRVIGSYIDGVFYPLDDVQYRNANDTEYLSLEEHSALTAALRAELERTKLAAEGLTNALLDIIKIDDWRNDKAVIIASKALAQFVSTGGGK